MATQATHSLLPRISLELVPVIRGTPEEARRISTNSWLKQMAQAVFASMAAASQNGVRAVDGNTYSILGDFSNYTIKFRIAAVTGSTKGVVAGTSDAAVDRDDFNLDALIAHGNGVGQLWYNAQQFAGPAEVDGGYRLTLTRQLDNNSGGGITIREVGLIADYNITGVSNNFTQFLFLRDLIPGGHAVPDGGSVIMRYHLDWLV
jgi:hypothetical protein